jgi:membrane protein required for colicin V production
VNTLDLIVISVVVLSGLFAFVRGFVREALSIVAWIGAGLVAYYGFERFAPTVGKLVTNPLAAQLTTAGLLFVVSLLVFSIGVGMLSDLVRASRMGSVDRSLGLIFGLARGVLVVCLGYLVTVQVIAKGPWPPKAEALPPFMAEARSRPFLESGAGTLLKMLPPDLLERGATAANQAKEQIESGARAKEQIDRIAPPPPQPAKGDKPPPGSATYDDREQQDLTRKIEQANGRQD